MVTPPKSEHEDEKKTTGEDTRRPNVAPAPQTASVSLPPFAHGRTDRWFRVIESQFDLHNPKITCEKTRYNYLVTAIPPEVSDLVADEDFYPRTDTPYTTLKNAILQETTMSGAQKVRKLLQQQTLGDQKPSQLLRQLKQLATGSSGSHDEVMLKELFLQQMPGQIKTILAGFTTTNLAELAKAADQMLEMTPTTPVVSSTTKHHETHKKPYTSELSISELAAELQEIKTMLRQKERSKSRGRNQSTQRNRSRSRPREDGTCWYHSRFGMSAKKCTAPCNFGTKNFNGQ